MVKKNITKRESESHSEEEHIKMSKAKEQLEEVEEPKQPEGNEDTIVEPVTEKVEEVVETPVEETPIKEPVEEKPAEDVSETPEEESEDVKPKKEEKVEENTEKSEALSKDIKQTKEELAVIKEARDELVSQYAKYKEAKEELDKITCESEKLSKELSEVKIENASIAEKLNKYVEAEEQINTQKRLERLTALSAKFKLLGQEKSTEQLSVMDDGILGEFEEIVDAALERTGETKEMPSVTAQSQAAEKLESNGSEEELKTEEVVKKEVKAPSNRGNETFFANICGELTKEQVGNYRNRKTLAL